MSFDSPFDPQLSSAKAAIITVGVGGRGFVVEGERLGRLVVTAAHCLPGLPPAHPASHSHERCYPNLLGPLGVPPTVWAECLFVDPVADLAVLCQPDNQSLVDEAEAYDVLVEAPTALRVGVVTEPCDAWLQTLDGRWKQCGVQFYPYGPARSLTLVGAEEGNAPGTSGSPIITANGRVVGVVSVGGEVAGVADLEQPGQPFLASDLPLWLLSDLRVDVVRARTACRQYIAHARGIVQGVAEKAGA